MDTQQILAALRAERDRITQVIAALETLQGGEGSLLKAEAATLRAAARAGKSGKRHISPEGRKRISEAAKRRWAEQRKTAGSGTRHMSAAARKRIGEAMKKRWAERKKAQTA